MTVAHVRQTDTNPSVTSTLAVCNGCDGDAFRDYINNLPTSSHEARQRGVQQDEDDTSN